MRKLILALAAVSLVTAPAFARSKKTNSEVTCKDGTTSKAGQGACSHHGGVEDAAAPKAKAKAAPRADSRAPAKADDKATPPDASSSKKSGGIFGGLFKKKDAPPATETSQGRASPPAAETSQGRAAPRPSRSTNATPGASPTAKCKDGSVSYSKQHSGACSHHGGVAEWFH